MVTSPLQTRSHRACRPRSLPDDRLAGGKRRSLNKSAICSTSRRSRSAKSRTRWRTSTGAPAKAANRSPLLGRPGDEADGGGRPSPVRIDPRDAHGLPGRGLEHELPQGGGRRDALAGEGHDDVVAPMPCRRAIRVRRSMKRSRTSLSSARRAPRRGRRSDRRARLTSCARPRSARRSSARG